MWNFAVVSKHSNTRLGNKCLRNKERLEAQFGKEITVEVPRFPHTQHIKMVGLSAPHPPPPPYQPGNIPEPESINPINAELNPICHFLALLRAHHILHVSRIRVESMTNSNDAIGNRTRDISACSAVPQPTASPCAHFSYCRTLLMLLTTCLTDIVSSKKLTTSKVYLQTKKN